jgi:DNA-binding LacI/PurR family transcriptional regulator
MDGAGRPTRGGRLTLDDLAASLGVSKTTVSNAFNRPDQLSAELRLRILEAARVAGYAGPDPVARMLRTRRAGALGLILPEPLPFSLDDPTSSELIRGIADACEERRLGLMILPAATRTADTRSIADVAVDGFVAYSLPRGTAALDAVVGRGIRVVIVDQPRLAGVSLVAVDDRGGAREAARHLVALGHRRIGIVSLPLAADGYTGPAGEARVGTATYDISLERLLGYREALAEAGVGPGGSPVFECAHSDEALGAEATRHLLELPDGVTAILGMSDRLAIGAIAAARAVHLDVPRDLSVVGFDDLARAVHARPSLTTVRQPLRLKGYAAARLLLDAPDRETGDGRPRDDAAARRPGAEAAEPAVDLPVELVVRHSTAAPDPARSAPMRA